MAKNKPLDVGRDSSASAPARRGPGLAAALLLMLLALLALALFILLQPSSKLSSDNITIYLQGSRPFLQGGTAMVQAFSTCGRFSLLLDGKEISYGNSDAKAVLPLTSGSHTLEAKNSQCSAQENFTVLVPECNGADTKPCLMGNCPGTQACSGGFYGECTQPPLACNPGDKVGCSVDGCRFGYATCNDCGSGFGPCLPRGNASSTGNCSSPNCG